MTKQPSIKSDNAPQRLYDFSDDIVGDTVDYDELSSEENDLLGSGFSEDKIAALARKAEHHRNEKFKNHFEKIALVALWMASSLFASLFLSWAWHTLLPIKYHWLNTTQMDSIKAILFGGIVSSVAMGHFRRRLQ